MVDIYRAPPGQITVVVSILNRNLKKKFKKSLSEEAHYPSMGLFMGSVLLSVDIPQIVEN